jgi:predicted nucleotidyltransferase component of viral defense system/DNA-directed RNA polymerase subunit RPC12/RpoP
MIDRRDIMDRAGELSLRPDVVEKDYVLGWLLAGIAQHEQIGESWVFKGGTCLKKVHFETYRFSEDLDFTLTKGAQLNADYLLRVFGEVAEWIYSETGIEIPREQIRFECYENKRGGMSAEGRIYYRGPLQPRGSLPRIKLDLTTDEVLVLEPATQRISHAYPDEPPRGIWVRCYPFAEVFAEKVRALGERGRPRDLYDVINLFRREEARGLLGSIRETLEAKCAFKGIELPSAESVEQYREELIADWSQMLAHQLPSLPRFEDFWSELESFFAWLGGTAEVVEEPQFGLGHGEEVIRVAQGGYSGLGLAPAARMLETIRFAAANHLCVDLDYRGEDGKRSTRRIEPYSLRRTSDGNVILHAERSDGRGHRAYRVDRMLGAAVADQAFRPRFRVELTPLGIQAIPETEGRSSGPRRIPVARRTRSTGIRYVYRCSYCGKKFTHERQNPRLRKHKDKHGYPCGGRSGYLVETRY